MKKKVGILTFHASHNYGSMLQAYALSMALRLMGHDAQIINFRSASQKMFYPKPYKYWDKQAIKGRLLSPSLFLKNIKKWNMYESFMKTEMPLTYEINHYSEIRSIIKENEYDAIITGGDQIWSVNGPDFNIGYLLPFKLSCKKIAYAPSMGNLQWLNIDDVSILFKSALLDYSFLSAREKTMADVVSNLLQKPVETMPDPAWLIPVEHYDNISYNNPLIRQKYLFYYEPRHEYEMSGCISKFASSKGLKAVCSSSPALPCPDCINFNNAGPKEFLNLIKNAEFICGYSMHMIIFALLFHKQFIVISDIADTRIVDLLHLFGLDDRIVSRNAIYKDFIDIEWDKVDEKVIELRSKGIEYLSKAI